MIKHWQSMHEYHCFLNDSKSVFDSSERTRLHSELWLPWQKLRLFDTDKAMAFLTPFYSASGRPAINQPQIIRSFVLFFLLFSMGLTPPSLTRWVNRLKSDRVLAALIGCPPDSLPPLGSYFDFMNRLWSAPQTALYSRNKLLPATWNSKKPNKPKGKGQKAPETKPRITEVLVSRLLDGRDLLFNYEARLQQFFYTVAVLPSMQSGLIPSGPLTVSGDGTAVHTMPVQGENGNLILPRIPMSLLLYGIFLTLMPPGVGTATLINTTSATLCSSYPVITADYGLTSRYF